MQPSLELMPAMALSVNPDGSFSGVYLAASDRYIMSILEKRSHELVLRRYFFRRVGETHCRWLWVVPGSRKLREIVPKDEPPIPVPGPMPQATHKRRLKRKPARTRR